MLQGADLFTEKYRLMSIHTGSNVQVALSQDKGMIQFGSSAGGKISSADNHRAFEQ